MAVPGFQEMLLPLLQLFSDGEGRTIQDCWSHVIAVFRLTKQAQNELLSSGTPRYRTNAHWAVTYLYRAGLLCRIRRGTYAITESGRDYLLRGLSSISTESLMEFESFRAFINKDSCSKHNAVIPASSVNTIKERSDMKGTISDLVETARKLHNTDLCSYPYGRAVHDSIVAGEHTLEDFGLADLRTRFSRIVDHDAKIHTDVSDIVIVELLDDAVLNKAIRTVLSQERHNQAARMRERKILRKHWMRVTHTFTRDILVDADSEKEADTIVSLAEVNNKLQFDYDDAYSVDFAYVKPFAGLQDSGKPMTDKQIDKFCARLKDVGCYFTREDVEVDDDEV